MTDMLEPQLGDKKTGSEEVGALIREGMEMRGLNQKELAFRARITPSTLSRIITGRRNGSIEVLSRIFAVLGISAAPTRGDAEAHE